MPWRSRIVHWSLSWLREWPKHFSNTAALVTLDLHSAKSYLLQRKLIFIAKATDLRFNWFQQNWFSSHEIIVRWPRVSLFSQGMQRARILLQYCIYHRDPNWCRLYWPNRHKVNYQKDWQRSEVGKVCPEGPLIAQVVTGESWPKLSYSAVT